MFNNSLEEQETTINLFPEAIQEHADVYTCMTVPARQLLKFAELYPDEVKIEKLDDTGMQATVPRFWVTIRPPKKMNFTEEQRQAMRERMNTIREKHNEYKGSE